MTNEEIIFNGIKTHLGLTEEAAVALVMEGKFPTFHTYERWKELGYQVRKGEHAELKLTIWKQGKSKEDENGKQIAGKMFLKNASFFGAGQVERMQK